MPALIRERLDRVEVLRLDRPAQRNAMDTALLRELVEAFEQAAGDDDLHALVVSTTEVRALSAGADVAEQLDPDAAVERMALFTRLYAALDETPVATVAVCVGNCVGAGAELAAGCDVRVGGDNLKLAWVGTRHGVPVGPARLVPLVGLARAKELVLTGRVIGAGEAQAIGFLHAVAEAEAAEAAALEIARTIASRSREAIATTKRMFRELEDTGRRVAYENDLLMSFQREGAGLPTRTGRGKTTGMGRALLIIDVQNDFASPDGALSVPGGEEILDRVNALAASGDFDLVVATRDWHPPDHNSFTEHGGQWPRHCVQGTWGAELHPGIDATQVDLVLDKGTAPDTDGYSAFDGTNLGDMLRERGIDEVVVVGLATDYCVRASALDALALGIPATVDPEAVRGVDLEPGDSERALAEVREAAQSTR